MRAKGRAQLIAEIPHLRRYARALARDPEQADDLVQSCLERALSRFHLWQPERALRPWLFRIMHNLHVNVLRHQGRRAAPLAFDDAAALAQSEAGQERSAEVRQVLRAIDALPEDQRAAVLLIGVEEFSYAEAADILGIPVGTLMSRLHRGRERLRRSLRMTSAPPPLRQIK